MVARIRKSHRGGRALAIKKPVLGSAAVAQFVVAVAPTEPLGATYTDGERIRSIVAIANLGKLDALGVGSLAVRRELASDAQELIDGDRQIADALSSGMINGIGDRRRGSDDSDFADAFDSERIDLVVLFIDENHVDRMHIRVYRHVIIGKIVSHKTAESMIGQRLFV